MTTEGEYLVSMEASEEISLYFEESARTLRATHEICSSDILHAATQMVDAIRRGGKIMLCGNGGSAADAQHCAAELVGRLSKNFERPAIPAIALTTDTSFLTAYTNDYGFAGLFARQIEALGKSEDVLILISTSGNSDNLCRAAVVAKERGIHSIGLLGGDGGRLISMVDSAVVVPSSHTGHVQECHGAIIHILCSLIERKLFAVR